MIDQLVLETIQYACKSVRMDERAFVESIRSASEIREQSEEAEGCVKASGEAVCRA